LFLGVGWDYGCGWERWADCDTLILSVFFYEESFIPWSKGNDYGILEGERTVNEMDEVITSYFMIIIASKFISISKSNFQIHLSPLNPCLFRTSAYLSSSPGN